ncbi:extracellular solute-binding protein [Vibrio sp. La 4.2.2]|uniref:extracellular solute-binding protein n=1 Tax=unclassified Vibrio TaxID=2614977 RepID=UPI001F44EDCC|nr:MULTISPECIES: extracellular solute-binding protein [unclassified Vibrio]MCF4172266.1 extracellular solute-binding protein [Vibrio sp. McD22-P3]MDA0108611.1 extracellular solute-binding protein [Vibrio sp. La 4.2.2]
MKKWLIGCLLAMSCQTATFAGTKLEVMTPVGNYMEFVRNVVVPEFQKLYPDVDVVVSNDENLETRMAAGDLPNLYAGVFGYQPAKYAKMGKLAYFEQFDGYQELIERIEPVFLRKNFGRTYYIPWNATTQLMIYNKELFKEAGLNPDRPPRTWDEFLSAAEKINQLPPREDGSPVYGTVFWNDVLSSGSWYWGMLAQLYYNFNKGEFTLLNRFGTHPVFDKEEANMATFLSTMQEAQKFAPLTMEKSFFSRNIGMWTQFGFGWKANLSEAAHKPMVIGEDVGLAPIPTVSRNDVSYSTLDGRALMIFKNSIEIEQLSWAFVQLLMDNELNHKANVALGQLPVLTELFDRPYYQSNEAKPFVDQLPYTIMSEPFSQSSDVANILLQQYSRVVLKKEITAEMAVNSASEQAKKIFAH